MSRLLQSTFMEEKIKDLKVFFLNGKLIIFISRALLKGEKKSVDFLTAIF